MDDPLKPIYFHYETIDSREYIGDYSWLNRCEICGRGLGAVYSKAAIFRSHNGDKYWEFLVICARRKPCKDRARKRLYKATFHYAYHDD